MQTSTKIYLITAVTGMLALASVAVAVEKGPVRGRLAARAGERWESLGITEEQKAKVKEILRQHQPEMEPLIRKSVEERRAMRDLVQTGSANESQIRAQAAKIAAVDADLWVVRSRVVADLRGVLSAEQLEKFQQMRHDFEDRMDQVMSRIGNRVRGK
jgi:Spy/CpxP family protein refolding chaperone